MEAISTGQKKTYAKPLKIELIPSSSFYVSLRSVLKPSEWRKISTEVRNRSRGMCSICGKQTGVRDLEAHEVWAYDENTRTRSLARIIPVCSKCHQTIHIGRAEIEGHLREAAEHYVDVNNCSMEEFAGDLKSAYKTWVRRSRMTWKTEVGRWVRSHKKEQYLPLCVDHDGVINESICPRCGKKLIKVKTPRGTMLGCSSSECSYRRGIPV